MNKKLIVVDVDDVLADTTEALRKFVNTEYGHNLQKEQYQVLGAYWGYYEAVWSQHDVNGDGVLDRFHSKNAEGSIDIQPVPGTIRSLKELSKRYRLAAVSSRTSIQQAETERWLKNTFGDIFESIQCIDTRHTGLNKGSFCQKLGASYLIDDNADHCKSGLEYGVIPILFGVYGWQGDRSEISPEFIQCSDWKQIAEYFDAQS